MASMPAISAPTWLEGFGEWAWPGLKPVVAEVGPAPWIPTLPRRIEPPVIRLPRERPRTLPRPLRLARLAVLVAVAGATLVLGSGLARSSPARVATITAPARAISFSSITHPFAVPGTRPARREPDARCASRRSRCSFPSRAWWR